MKNLRVFLWIGLALILFVNYQTWNLEYAPRDAAAAAAAQQAAADQQANAPPTGGCADGRCRRRHAAGR